MQQTSVTKARLSEQKQTVSMCKWICWLWTS